MTKILKMINFWTFIEQPDEPDASAAKKATWAGCHEKTCYILQYVVAGNVYDEIKYHTNLSTAWDLLATMFKPQGAEFLNDVFRRLDSFTLKDCNNSIDYIIKFGAFVNEFRSFSSEFKMDNNFFIYKFQSNLGPEHASYFEKYVQDHDPFNVDGKVKYSLSLAMQYFGNMIKNPSTFGPKSASTGLLSNFYASYPHSNSRDQAPTVYYKGSAPNWKIVEIK